MNSSIRPAEIYLPNDGVDLGKWAVVACDQFTSERDYWEELAQFVGGSPSMLNIVFPEVFLGDSDGEKRVNDINKTMLEYGENVLTKHYNGYILTERITEKSGRRLGLVATVDLEKYSFNKGDKTPIRATEGTILSRIPPRVAIRQNASIESPHIMLLIEDEMRMAIEPLYKKKDSFKKVYDFKLNMKGGRVVGYLVEDDLELEAAFERLERQSIEKYGSSFFLAVGDGNHSLATAKTCWENTKKTLSIEQQNTHPARYALVEIVNIFDDGLTFEPIHRIVEGVNEKFCDGLMNLFGQSHKTHGKVIDNSGEYTFPLSSSCPESVKIVQEYIDNAISCGDARNVDYVHGEGSVKKIVETQSSCVGIVLNSMNKTELFDFVDKNGALPRKTFSMGEAEEKRYYLECRKIK